MKQLSKYTRLGTSGIERLCREYTDINGKRQKAIYDHEGPSGSRWTMDDGSLITIDYYEKRQKNGLRSIQDPWADARDIVDSWVAEEMDDLMRNRLHNCKNPNQGKTKKVLCVCSAGLLRSPTAALVLSQDPFGFNTRAAGMDGDHALIPVDEVLLEWADEVVCMSPHHAVELKLRTKKPVICLDLKDIYEYRDPELIKLIASKYVELTKKAV